MSHCEYSSCAESSSVHSVPANAIVASGSSDQDAMTSASVSQRSSQAASSCVARRNVTRAMRDLYVARADRVNRRSELDADLPRNLAADDVAEDVLLDILVEEVLRDQFQRDLVGHEAPAERGVDLCERRRPRAREQHVGPVGLVLIIDPDVPESLAVVVRQTQVRSPRRRD